MSRRLFIALVACGVAAAVSTSAATGLSVCASKSVVRLYGGPVRPPAEVAMVELHRELRLISIRRGDEVALRPTGRRFELIPGSTTLRLVYQSHSYSGGVLASGFSNPIETVVEVKAGHRYTVRPVIVEGGVDVAIDDTTKR